MRRSEWRNEVLSCLLSRLFFPIVIVSCLSGFGKSVQGDFHSDSLAVRTILDSNGLDTIPLEKVSRVQSNRITVLRLNKLHLKTLPSIIGQLTALDTLHFEDNLLETLPKTILQLNPVVFADGNKLCHVESEIDKWLSDHQYCPGFCVTWLAFQNCSSTGVNLLGTTGSTVEHKKKFDMNGRRIKENPKEPAVPAYP